MDVMAHAPLIRNNTTPIFKRDRDPDSGPPTMSSAPRASQLSGTTAYNSSNQSLASLSSAQTAVAPQNGASGGNVVATANIINQKADASRSLYQICISLRQRLSQVPGFEVYFEQLDQPDPVEAVWSLLREGFPLLTIFNEALQPAEHLKIDDAHANAPSPKKSKIAAFKFVQACLKDLSIPSSECFVINDLMGDDTTGLVKVTQVVNYVLDLAEQRGLLLEPRAFIEGNSGSQPGSQMSYRDHVIKELVDTERKYVQDLEVLHDLKKTLEVKGVIPGDVIHQIFLNINAILDFQRRFLIRVETTNSMPPNTQQWGGPFVTFEDAFDIYTPFIANQRKAAQTAQGVFDKIQVADHPVAVDFNTLDGFLLKPMQRLVKYPLLLKDLAKKCEEETAKQELVAGVDAAERVLTKANEAVNRDLLDEAMEDLKFRVDDWKNHRMEQFGSLLRHGVYTVVTGKTEQEKDYEIYLFEYILLCCKEASANKSKDKKDKTRSSGPKVRNKNAKLQLKGRIFMTNVTEVVTLARQGSYSVQIWWKGDPGVENFTIKFTNEETMRKWAAGLDKQRKANTLTKSTSSPDLAPPEFPWLRAQAGTINSMENPYKEQDMDDDEDYGAGSIPFGVTSSTGGTMIPRNASSNSLRQRSTTGDSSQSLASIALAPPPRYPIPPPPVPLSLQTQLNSRTAPSPGERVGESYFSPVAESPVSSRTSTASGMTTTPGYPFPKAATPQPPWEDTTNRYTAPAMPRAPSRDGSSPNQPYGPGRGARPSMSGMPPSAAQQQRSRSYSTPDINGAPVQRRNTAGVPGQNNGVPAVPGIPAHLHHDSNIPRSQSGSPRQDLPVRSNTQSPGAQRERLHQSSGSIGGTMSQFPAHPVYPRQTTPNPQPPNQQMPMDGPAPAQAPPQMAGSPAMSDVPLPTQLKVKVNCEGGTYFTLVVAFNITYQTLIDRIDAKLARFTSNSIGKGQLKLRYRDEDGDYVSIESDDDIQIAFMEWREGMRNMFPGGVGEIELFCVGDTSTG